MTDKRNTGRWLQYLVIGAAMISLLLVCVVTFFVNGQEKVKKDETCTVAIAPSKGFTVVSSNPVTVTKGEQAEFRIRLDENYACVDSDHYRFVGDRVLIDDVSDDRTYYIETIQKCRVAIEETENGTVSFSGDAGGEFLAGDEVTLLLSPKLNYEIGGILVNDVAYPVRSDGVYTFTVNHPCTVRGLFVGVEKEFVLAKKNIGNVDISGNTEDGRFLYGDHLVVSVVPSEGILFKGWSSEGYLKDGGVLIDTAEAYDFVLTEDTTIYANFEDVNTYSASYVSDFLTGEIKPFASLSADEYGELPLYYDVKRRDGYVLTGFNTERDASGDSYSVGSMFVMPHRDVVFYPEWTKCTDSEDLLWQSNGNTVEVLGIKEGAIDKNGVLCLPDEINGMNVTAIRADALSGNLDLKTVILPPGVVSIGDRCFSGCSSLKAVYLPETLAALGRNAFADCDAFTDLRLLQSYAKIYDLDYDSALAEKYMRLKTTEGKRVILVGGSNLCFGINSRMIREAFPQYDVVNFSTSHLYGLSPLLDLVERNVHEGDVIVLSPEYYPEMFCARETPSFNNWEYVDCNPDMLKDIDVSRNQAFLNTMLTFFYNKRVHSPRKIFNSNPVYARSGFNEYGDLETKRTANKILEPSIPSPELITDAGIGRINGAFRSYTEKGAKCFFTFTSMSLGTNSKSGVVGAAGPFLLKLREGLDADVVTIISEFGDYLFDASQCYGNCYHLSMEAAVLRTAQLVKDLSPYLKE